MTKTTAHVVIDLDDVVSAGGVAEAIANWCENSDTTSCGVVGSSFSTSGPGNGWSVQHGPDDFALRAMIEGAMHYIDESDGRMCSAEPAEEDDEDAYADMGGGWFTKGSWSSASVVRLEVPDAEDVLAHPQEAAAMARAVIDCHGEESDRASWAVLVRSVKEAATAMRSIDADDFDE